MVQKKILVTGGAGYIGSHTTLELCKNGYTPIVIDNFSRSDSMLLEEIKKNTEYSIIFYEGDCTSKIFLQHVFQKEKNVQGVMHFAAYKSVNESVYYPLLYYRNNINTLLSLLEAMEECAVSNLIFSSSCTVYGEPDYVPVKEDTPFKKPQSPYGATKQINEQILEETVKNNPNIQVVSLRYCNPIGADSNALIGAPPISIGTAPDNLVSCLMQTAAGINNELVLFGGDYDTPDGTCIRDFIHVVDLARAHVNVIEHMLKQTGKAYRVYNLGMGQGISALELVKQFIEVTGMDIAYTIGQHRQGDITKIYACVEKVKTELGWSSIYSVREALQHAWLWEKKIRHID